ncbi:putative Transcriptional regulator, AraC family [Vibrio nigripulchritudo SO65]|nr:putative Transcriptional regulator, AraC family [Vibrio nigripulchritudo AM115]CCN39310.1 putative Transcriptional regulator, AraC family [Vibrio nigripulchritudo FTn2]CCN64354.1 putative Transcriptional regulator, AraC family [Vibrio nigripulchritudo POn4]CCN78977.1 putative Transcriptional regulator, AraC family [Vibrio nigripulchritudo SO65]
MSNNIRVIKTDSNAKETGTQMTASLIQAGHFHAATSQPLRNVLIYAPTIIWVAQGEKRLWWHEETLNYTESDWLVSPASHYLTFVNEPTQLPFHSRTLTFLAPPPSDWVTESEQQKDHNTMRIKVTPTLAFCFETLFEMANSGLTREAQKQFLYGFYAELKQAGMLHKLFPHQTTDIKEKLAQYLNVNPGHDHKVETVAEHFFMSRATLNRKLAAENTTFRQVLTNVRMVYALGLMQQSRSQLSVALSCGYQSETRFANRFKQTFGITPKEYVRTL